MSSFRPGRFVGILLGTVAILAIGVYGPFALLAPLPVAQITPIAVDPPAASPLTLSIDGAAAVRAAEAQHPLAANNADAPLPMAAIAKIITALMVLDAKPMAAGEDGANLTIGTADYADYIDYTNEDSRTVIVIPGEVWTEREALQALILGSSNNHADTLARWAFGSVDEFLSASGVWLTENGLDNTVLADTTGLSEQSAGSAADLSHLAELALANPVITEILANPATPLVNKRGVENTTAFLEESGITGISNSYTDAAGVCFLFRLEVPSAAGPVALYGAVLASPGYDELAAGMESLAETAPAGVEPVVAIAEGTAYATIETAWGQRVQAVAGNDVTAPAWELSGETAVQNLSDQDALRTATTGTKIGRVSLATLGGEVSAPLTLSATIHDPGPLWRLSNPLALLLPILGGSSGGNNG